MEALLTAKTSALCFNKDDFMVKDFSVDKFVSNYRKFVSLETMLDDIGLYHKILCSAMIELINKDYGDFVNLSSNLVGLDKSIKNLSVPLEKLKAEVQDMKNNLDDTLSSAKSQFSKYSMAYKMKVLAHHVLCVLEGLKKIEDLNLSTDKTLLSDVFERMALDFNVVQFHMNQISCLKNIENKKAIVEQVSDTLKRQLEQLFLQSLSTNDIQSLSKVLQIYSVIDKEMELEKFFSESVVRPYMKCHITEENIIKMGLSGVYDNVLNFISSSSCIVVLDATRGTKRSVEVVPVCGYDFLVNAVLPEVLYSFELIAPVHVYAPGDPHLFHVNYTSTILFLDHFERYCHVQTSVKRLRNHESYRRFLSKFNLDVYYEIRFQEIAGNFENALLQAFTYVKDIKGVGNENTYLLNTSSSVSDCVKLCWDDKIFLQPLSHNFFRLTLQLISRFYKSTCSYLKCSEDKSVSPVEAAVIIKDVEMLIVEFKNLFDCRISLKISRNVVEAAKKSYQESIRLLQDIIPLASSLMVKSLTKQCCTHLKLITDIPRLYRKTNRDIPSKESGYVSSVFNSLTEFLSETDSILSAKHKDFCLREVTNGIIVQCVIMIRDVLTSIQKMEQSLKILKRARDKGQMSTGAITDDDKIRRQLVIDINCIEKKVQNLGLEVENMKSFKELKGLMNSTEKKENLP